MGADGKYMGGTAVILAPHLAARVQKTHMDPQHLGRFTGVTLRGTRTDSITIFSTYNAPPSSNVGSMWNRQWQALKVGKQQVAQHHWDTLELEVREAQAAGCKVMICGDMNTVWSLEERHRQREWQTEERSHADRKRTHLMCGVAKRWGLTDIQYNIVVMAHT